MRARARTKDQPVAIEFRPGMRRLIEDAIESMLLLLDEIDGDADFEEQHDREWDFAESGIADQDGLHEQWPGLSNAERVE